jgi:hypothetical protein
MHYVALFFLGMLLCNSVPHLVSGLLGQPFPTPFAKPRGVGDSSPLVNFLWGFVNLLAALALLAQHPLALTLNADLFTALAGALVIGVYLALHFGKVRSTRTV